MFELRDYQKEAIQKTRQAISEGFKTIIIQSPTGSGKGIILSHIINSANNKGKTVLFLVHRSEILYQVSEYMHKYGIVHGLIKSGEEPNYTHPVQLASFQTIHRRMQRYQDKFDIIVVDECFPAGTLIDGRPIESMQVGDLVQSLNTNTGVIENKQILQTFKNKVPDKLVDVRLQSGKTITCTPNHPFYVDNHWKPAIMLESGDMVQHITGGQNESYLLNLRENSGRAKKKTFGIHQEGQGFLFARLFKGILPSKIFGSNVQNKQKIRIIKNESKQSYGDSFDCRENEDYQEGKRDTQCDGLRTGRQRESISNSAIIGISSWLANGIRRISWGAFCRLSDMLQGGHCESRFEDRHRSGWGKPSRKQGERTGCKEKLQTESVRVDSVEVYESASERGFTELRGKGFVYNIEVEGNNNYFANGVLVHNCHHATAKTYLEVIKEFKKQIIIGFSATPTRKNGMGLGNLFDKLIQVASIQELTDMGFLAPIKYYAPVQPDLTGVKLQAGDYNEKQLEPVMLKKELVNGIVEYWFKYGENRKTVVFATGVAHSIAIKEKFAAAGIVAEHLDGNTPHELRSDIIHHFKKGDIQIIVNCQILTEGVDVPDISCVILARPTKSLPMYMQMLGRGMRVIEGKENCVLIDHAGCVYEHGFVHEITDWKLDSSNKTENEKEKERKKSDSKPITCPECDVIYTGQLKCPQCGNIPEARQFGKDVEYIDGQLGEVCFKSKTAAPEKFTKEIKQEWFSQLLYYSRNKGYRDGWAANKYRDKFGVWPKNMNYFTPHRENPEVMAWLKHKQIAYAKAKEKSANDQTGNRSLPLPL
jgi:superfamily II DNA or RNA helicase